MTDQIREQIKLLRNWEAQHDLHVLLLNAADAFAQLQRDEQDALDINELLLARIEKLEAVVGAVNEYLPYVLNVDDAGSKKIAQLDAALAALEDK